MAEKKFFFYRPGPLLSQDRPSDLSEGLDQPLATDDRKQYQCQNIALNNKTEPLFWDSIDAKK